MATNAAASVPCDIKDLALANQGKRRVDWAFQSMPVLQAIRKQFIKEQPFEGVAIAACLPLTPGTASLVITLRDGGARVMLCGSEPATTQDDVAASLVRDYAMSVFAISAPQDHPPPHHVTAVLDCQPRLLIDHGAHLAAEPRDGVIGVIEGTAAGASKLNALARQAPLTWPVISLHQSSMHRMMDSRYGTGQSTLDVLVQTTGALIAGMTIVVAGYGATGRGIASRARGLGANVIITEADPIRALDAALDGFRVLAMQEAARVGDVFVSATGNRSILNREHFDRLRDGALLANAGSSTSEIDVEALARSASSRREVNELIEEFKMKDGRRVHLLGAGRSIRHAAADRLPAAVVDVVLGAGALAAEYLLNRGASLPHTVQPLPDSIDKLTARMKLMSMGINIEKLTVEQEAYLSAQSEGN